MDSQYQQGAYMPMSSVGQSAQYAPSSFGYSSQQQHQQQQQQNQSQQHPSQQLHQHHHQHPHHQVQQNQHHNHPPQQQQQDSVRDTSTLPPLHAQTSNFNQLPSIYTTNGGSHPHTPTNGSAPATSSMSSGALHAFSHQATPVTSGSMPPPMNSYAAYSTSQPAMPQSSTPGTSASSMAATSAQHRLPDLRPMMPQAGYNAALSGLPAFQSYMPNMPTMPTMSAMPSQDPEPTHVVGSQGRRGILPSAPGRAAPPAPGNPAVPTRSQIPQKDENGKYPCPHCDKTYLHSKHLKRHLLRHTGDRPYMCHLCKDTFSRSDILKRHFQKCSIRRGNPTGANHLAHQRRNTNRTSVSSADQIGLANIPEVAGQTYVNGTSNLNSVHNSPSANSEQSPYATSVASMSGRSSRANSLIHPPTLGGETRHSLSGLANPPMVSSAANGERVPASATGYASFNMRPHSMSNPMPPTYAFHGMGSSVTNGQNYQSSYVKQEQEHASNGYTHQPTAMQDGRSQTNGVGSHDWSSGFAPHGQDGFMTQTQQGGAAPPPAKSEPPVDGQAFNGHNENGSENFFSGIYSNPSAFGEDSGAHHLSGFPNWNMDPLQSNPLSAKANALLTYVFLHRTSTSDDACDEMRRCLTVENVKHFIEQFMNFQAHWPLIHMPTFDISNTNNALVLAMICIGAVYSDRRDIYEVRQMMELVRDAVKQSSRVYQITSGMISEGDAPLGSLDSDMEEMQACSLLTALFVWHGNADQRATAREEFGQVVAIARRMHLNDPAPPGHLADSVLHQHNQITQESLATWTWSSWIAQETRGRIMYSIVLMDAALVMFFNTQPQIDPHEVRLSLPADDAAWDAKTVDECRTALGFNGAAIQQVNMTGSQNLRQPDLRSVMRSLMDPTYDLRPRVTNAYSKFILIHVLNVQACKIQRANLHLNPGHSNLLGNPPTSAESSGPPTPQVYSDSLAQDGTTSSGTATPSEGTITPNIPLQSMLRSILMAMSKWKAIWDTDVNIQYPPTTRRVGFSRDGIHFYYLGQSFMRSNKASEWIASPDVRFMQVMTLLKKIKGFVVNDNYHSGQDTGSIGDIDDSYGIGDLTLDMKLLFRKIGDSDSPHL